MPIISGGGGGGTPFAGGTITSPLTIDTATGDKLNLDNGSGVRLGDLSASATGLRVYYDPDGASAPALELNSSAHPSRPGWALLDENFDILAEGSLGELQIGKGGSVVLRHQTSTSYMMYTQHSVPADATLQTGDLAFWYDQSNAAPKLMVKAKTDTGAVVTAAIALA